MDRLYVVQKILNIFQKKIYLKIGVEYGYVFLRVRADRKFAVDPIIKISFLKKILFPHGLLRRKYFKTESDTFFKIHANKVFTKNKPNVVFIDGLHTYEQSLKDVENALMWLDNDGVIIMHDCNPTTASMAATSQKEAINIPGWNGSWCGDAWKTILHLRSLRTDLNVFVLDADYGLGIITKNKPDGILQYSKQDIENMEYEDLNINKNIFLNLKKPDYLDDFLESIFY